MTNVGIEGIGDATLIAAGGSALVYMAPDAAGKTVAIKILRGIRGDEIGRRFQREQSSAARLSSHPNIIDIESSGITADGELYLVMPLHGGSLQDELDETGPMALEQAIADVVAAAHAIEYAHSRDVFHRDIKPANVLRAADGSIVVTDFGIARVTDAGITSATVGAATPLYAAPELLAEKEVSARSEVYSLGALLYALLAGRPAFGGTDNNLWATINRVRTEPVPPIPAVPLPVMRVITQAMAKDPDERTPSAGLFAGYLSAAINAPSEWAPPKALAITERLERAPDLDVPTPVEPIPATTTSDASSMALRTIATLGTIVVLGLLGWWAVNTLFTGDSPPSANVDGPIDTSLPAPERSPAQSPEPAQPTAAPTATVAPERLVGFSGEHFTALLPEGWSVLAQDVDVGYGFRSRFVAGDMYLIVDTTPAERRTSDETIAESARSIAASVGSASQVQTESVDGLTLHTFTFQNDRDIESIDIFFEVDGDGYAIVAGSPTTPLEAFRIARQVALSVRGTP